MSRSAEKSIVTERRADEDSLYYWIDRDLERGALFPGANYWTSQVGNRRMRMDYGVRFGSLLVCIEVKADVPLREHFDQVYSQYSRYCNAVFLAYPADYAGEALFLSKTRGWNEKVGLISLTPFRSHIIRPAIKFPRRVPTIWSRYFENDWEGASEPTWRYQVSRSALKSGTFLCKVDRVGDQTAGEAPYAIQIPAAAWRSLAILYAASEAVDRRQFFRYPWLLELSRERMGWGWPNYDWWVGAQVVEDLTHGRGRLWTYGLSPQAVYQRKLLGSALRFHLTQAEWRRIALLATEIREEFRTEQGKAKGSLFA